MMAWVFRQLSRLALRVFYARIEVEGLGHVPSTGGVVFVPNHTNALVDPLVVQHAVGRRIIPTAKTGLRANPLLRLLLWILGAVLFERADSSATPRQALRQNVQAIGRCRSILIGGGALTLFPEGKSHSDPQMRPFKQGLARIMTDLPAAVAVVPVAIVYSAKTRFRSSVLIRYGQAIDTSEMPAERQAFTSAIEGRVRGLCYQTNAATSSEVQASTNLAGVCLTRFEVICAAARELELMLVGGVIVAFGLAHHLLPFVLVRWIARRLTREEDQFASNAVYPGMLLFPLLYGAQLLLVWLLMPAWLAGAYTVTLPLTGWYTLHWRDRVAWAWARRGVLGRIVLKQPILDASTPSRARRTGDDACNKGQHHAGNFID